MDETKEKPTWTEVVAPIVRRFEIGATFGQKVEHNPEGARAVASLMKEMARIIDEEIERRRG